MYNKEQDVIVLGTYDKRVRILVAFCIFMLLLGMSGAAVSGRAYADERRLVKVAFFPMDGYHIKYSDGTYGGMDVEYLDALCRYVNWEIEYVECDSWEEALELLAGKKVDLVGSAQYSEERAQIYQYASLSSGYTFGVIATNADSTLAYEDFEALKDVTFGIVEGYVRTEEFLQYLADHGISNPKLLKYENTAALQTALAAGEIDALVHSFTEVKEGQRLIGRFAPMPFYYMTYQGNDDVIRELDQAIADLKMNRPELEAELMNRFYHSRLDQTIVLTTEEKEYIAEGRTIPVGYVDGHYPFCYEADGEFVGLTRELLEETVMSVGLNLEFLRFATYREAEDALQNGVIDVLTFCAESEDVLKERHLDVVKEYAEIPLVLVMNKHKSMSDIDTLATVEYLSKASELMLDQSEVALTYFELQKDCLDAVKSGDADAALCSGYLSEYLLSTDLKYNALEVKTVLSSEYFVSMIVREDVDECLFDIFSKTISAIDTKEINEYVLKEDVYPLVSITHLLRSHSFMIMAIMFLVIVGVVSVAYYLIRDTMKIQKLMYKDMTIDIWNLNYLTYQGKRKLLPERKEQYAVAYLNIVQFRRYNIIYGWNAGERLLKITAEVLTRYMDDKKEICARNQGDRFVLLLTLGNRDVLLGRLKELKETLEKHIYTATENRMSVEFGVYVLPKGSHDLRQAVDYANQALESVDTEKDEGIRFYDTELENEIKGRHEREKLLESIDIEKNFVAYYQPKVDIRTGELVGAEALVRFLDPTAGGTVRAPGFFVPYYEQTGRITEIDFFVMEAVCRMLRRRMDDGRKVVPVSCNFSRMNFIKPGFAERFEGVLAKYQVPKELIEVEITETLVVEELQYQIVKQTLEILREKQIHLSIDDFGAGYSSLGIFEQIPASVIKLDRSFFLNQEDRTRQVKIMRGIVKLAGELDAQVVCEGVETKEDVSLMNEIGAYVAQGYYYSKPIPEAAFEEKFFDA